MAKTTNTNDHHPEPSKDLQRRLRALAGALRREGFIRTSIFSGDGRSGSTPRCGVSLESRDPIVAREEDSVTSTIWSQVVEYTSAEGDGWYMRVRGDAAPGSAHLCEKEGPGGISCRKMGEHRFCEGSWNGKTVRWESSDA